MNIYIAEFYRGEAALAEYFVERETRHYFFVRDKVQIIGQSYLPNDKIKKDDDRIFDNREDAIIFLANLSTDHLKSVCNLLYLARRQCVKLTEMLEHFLKDQS